MNYSKIQKYQESAEQSEHDTHRSINKEKVQ